MPQAEQRHWRHLPQVRERTVLEKVAGVLVPFVLIGAFMGLPGLLWQMGSGVHAELDSYCADIDEDTWIDQVYDQAVQHGLGVVVPAWNHTEGLPYLTLVQAGYGSQAECTVYFIDGKAVEYETELTRFLFIDGEDGEGGPGAGSCPIPDSEKPSGETRETTGMTAESGEMEPS